jgi:hypothetical protein
MAKRLKKEAMTDAERAKLARSKLKLQKMVDFAVFIDAKLHLKAQAAAKKTGVTFREFATRALKAAFPR